MFIYNNIHVYPSLIAFNLLSISLFVRLYFYIFLFVSFFDILLSLIEDKELLKYIISQISRSYSCVYSHPGYCNTKKIHFLPTNC